MEKKTRENKQELIQKYNNFKPKNAPNHFMQGIKTERIKPISALRSKTPVYEKRKKPMIAISRLNEDDPFNSDLAHSALGKAKKDQTQITHIQLISTAMALKKQRKIMM